MSLTQSQVAQYRQDGYLIARGVLTDEDFQPIEQAYDALIDHQAEELLAAGQIQSTHKDQPFSHRLATIARELDDETYGNFRSFTATLDIMRARLRSMFKFFFSPRLLSAVESIVGPEITLSPIQHFRPYLPARNDAQPMRVPWHQDQGVTKKEADAAEILTCWIPLVHVNPDAGCLQVLPGVTPMGLLEHQREGGTMIKPEWMPDTRPVDCPMQRGDILLMNSYTPHRGQVNRTDKVRWSMDLRFQKTGTPTGRPFWPAFVIQSKTDPASVQNDYDNWCARWIYDLEASKGMHLHRV